jgi:hypothetical protein
MTLQLILKIVYMPQINLFSKILETKIFKIKDIV